VFLLARELVISGVRGFSESQGIQFPATPAGKIKMLVQSITIGVVLFQLANLPRAAWAVQLKVALVWLTLIVTVGSGFYYLRRARRLLLGGQQTPR
jgi:CDP-diacylglycerol--glycerol-3-phosphate 3-phosphatidyltransferase